MVKIYGASDDLCEIEGSDFMEDEIGCFKKDVEIRFYDGTIIRVGYNKPGLGIWYIVIVNRGDAESELTVCDDEDADIYSDIFEIDAEVLGYKLVDQEGPE